MGQTLQVMVKTETLPPSHQFFWKYVDPFLLCFCRYGWGLGVRFAPQAALRQEIRKFGRDMVRGEPLNSNLIGEIALALKLTLNAISGPFGKFKPPKWTPNLQSLETLSIVKIPISNGGVESLMCTERWKNGRVTANSKLYICKKQKLRENATWSRAHPFQVTKIRQVFSLSRILKLSLWINMITNIGLMGPKHCANTF